MNRTKLLALVLMAACLGLLTIACGSPTDPNKPDPKVKEKMTAVVQQYAKVVWASYQDVEKGLVALQTSINEFLAAPSKDKFEDAKKKWLAVRTIYGQTEAFRFYSGPIDDDRGLEGRINAWPLDENYIDYVENSPDSGIINDTKKYPTIDKKLLIELNEKDGEKNVSLGFHAIEFLLWGQDLSKDSPGTRPHTDFVKDGTAKNQERRGTYLKLAMEILLEDVRKVMNDWKPDTAGNYRDKFVKADAAASLTQILTGIGTLSGGELSGERMSTPYKEKDQEEEHSCFSDNTKVDILTNAQGVQNVYLGKFGSVAGESIDALVRMKDPKLADQLKQELEGSITAIKAIPEPFDQAIMGDDSADGRKKVKAAIDALQKQTQTIAKVGALFNLKVNTELPE